MRPPKPSHPTRTFMVNVGHCIYGPHNTAYRTTDPDNPAYVELSDEQGKYYMAKGIVQVSLDHSEEKPTGNSVEGNPNETPQGTIIAPTEPEAIPDKKDDREDAKADGDSARQSATKAQKPRNL